MSQKCSNLAQAHATNKTVPTAYLKAHYSMQQNPYRAPNAELELEKQPANTSGIFSRQGRIGRLRYSAYISTASLIGATLAFGGIGIAEAAKQSDFTTAIAFGLIGTIVCGIMNLFYTARRLNDLNQHWGWLILYFIPAFALFLVLYLVFAPGSAGSNKYGAPAAANKWFHYIMGLLLPALLLLLFFLIPYAGLS